MTAAEHRDALPEPSTEPPTEPPAVAADRQQVQERDDDADWERLMAIYFAHQERIAPGAFHCFCGSLDELRAAVADLERNPTRTSRAPARDATAAHRAAGPGTDPLTAAALAAHRAQQRVAHDVDRDAPEVTALASPAATRLNAGRHVDSDPDIEVAADGS